jgi:hypothetical protein
VLGTGVVLVWFVLLLDQDGTALVLEDEDVGTGVVLELLLDAVGAGVPELLLDMCTGVVLDVLGAALVLLLLEESGLHCSTSASRQYVTSGS